jgi:glycosyltransferase involved in cell wall biosynthesis
MRVLVLPRDPNPYQDLLYGEMRSLGVQVSYLGELTGSRTVNVLLLPVEAGLWRLAGARVIHLHWVFAFSFPGARRWPVLRRAAQAWFLVWLRVCRILGMRLVWTAHNVVPHEPVFADDVAMRRTLARASQLVVAHSQATLVELARLGAAPARSAVIRHGPLAGEGPVRPPGQGGGPREFLFLGRIEEYKGADDLLAAFGAMPGDLAARLTVAGKCQDARLRARLLLLARDCGPNLTLRLEFVPDGELAALLAAADVVVLPFRRVTTSGTAMLAMSYGRPLIVPDLPQLAEFPERAVLRYDGQVLALTQAMADLARADAGTLAGMSAAASSYAFSTSWRQIADRTLTEMTAVLDDTPRAGAAIQAVQAGPGNR